MRIAIWHWVENLVDRFKSSKVLINSKQLNGNDIDKIRENFMNAYKNEKQQNPNWSKKYLDASAALKEQSVSKNTAKLQYWDTKQKNIVI